MIYNPDKHHRRSIRFKEYDYSQAGTYFVTICTQDRDCLFGDIIEGKIQLNPAGNMIHNWWNQIAQKYLNVELDECVIMSNHIHGIIIVGADPRVCPDTENRHIVVNMGRHNDSHENKKGEIPDSHMTISGEHTGSHENKKGEQKGSHTSISDEHINSHLDIKGEHIGSPLQQPVSLSRMIQWFKTMTTNEYIRNVKQNDWHPFNKRLWQRNYYEHIIRDENELNRIRKYIIENPPKWDLDDNNPNNIGTN